MEGEGKTTYRISDMPKDEKPRERLINLGARALSKNELLAILLRTGVQGENVLELAERLLRDFGGLQGLHRASLDELSQTRGIGPTKAVEIKAAIELGRRLEEEKVEEKITITSPEDAVRVVQHDLSAARQEQLWVMTLDTRNHVLKTEKLYSGSLNHSSVRVGEVFESAIRLKAAALIVIHNHPSGDPTPSPEDIQITQALRQAGDLLDIKVLDHIIIGQKEWASLKQRKLGFDG